MSDLYRSATRLAEEMVAVPCVVFAFALENAAASSVVPALQNLMLRRAPLESALFRRPCTRAS
jgi:hypothetical protein